ncbi:unnamed protein product [Darwinula stevensoni]|uniref:PDEase domain-containing protein n=1 Tax=Darwinula stevensoni TaxID=69355 RepID=A0A7R8X641_9CRUS|nr:unnamed protein product [Darwinula stevensoni]CAG0881687.1 unnamed protein product [Darwinula stevensoni]
MKVCDEFFRQGDFERDLNLPVTTLCDREKTSVSKIQVGFLQYVVSPLFEEWDRCLQTALSRDMMEYLRENHARWDIMLQEEQEETKAKEQTTVAETHIRVESEEEEEEEDELATPPAKPFDPNRLGLSPEDMRVLVGRRHSMPLSWPRVLSRTTIVRRRESLPGREEESQKSPGTGPVVSLRVTEEFESQSTLFSPTSPVPVVSGDLIDQSQSELGEDSTADELLTEPSIAFITNTRAARRLSVVMHQSTLPGSGASSVSEHGRSSNPSASGTSSPSSVVSPFPGSRLTRQQTFQTTQCHHSRPRFYSMVSGEKVNLSAVSSSDEEKRNSGAQLCEDGKGCGTPPHTAELVSLRLAEESENHGAQSSNTFPTTLSVEPDAGSLASAATSGVSVQQNPCNPRDPHDPSSVAQKIPKVAKVITNKENRDPLSPNGSIPWTVFVWEPGSDVPSNNCTSARSGDSVSPSSSSQRLSNRRSSAPAVTGLIQDSASFLAQKLLGALPRSVHPLKSQENMPIGDELKVGGLYRRGSLPPQLIRRSSVAVLEPTIPSESESENGHGAGVQSQPQQMSPCSTVHFNRSHTGRSSGRSSRKANLTSHFLGKKWPLKRRASEGADMATCVKSNSRGCETGPVRRDSESWLCVLGQQDLVAMFASNEEQEAISYTLHPSNKLPQRRGSVPVTLCLLAHTGGLLRLIIQKYMALHVIEAIQLNSHIAHGR